MSGFLTFPLPRNVFPEKFTQLVRSLRPLFKQHVIREAFVSEVSSALRARNKEADGPMAALGQ